MVILIRQMELQQITNIFHYDDLFDQIFATNQNNNIALKIIPKSVYLSSINYISTDLSTK